MNSGTGRGAGWGISPIPSAQTFGSPQSPIATSPSASAGMMLLPPERSGARSGTCTTMPPSTQSMLASPNDEPSANNSSPRAIVPSAICTGTFGSADGSPDDADTSRGPADVALAHAASDTAVSAATRIAGVRFTRSCKRTGRALSRIPRRLLLPEGRAVALGRTRHARELGLGRLCGGQRAVGCAEPEGERQRLVALGHALAAVVVDEPDVLEQRARTLSDGSLHLTGGNR